MSTEQIQTPAPITADAKLFAWMASYEPVLDMRTDTEKLRACAMGCGRTVVKPLSLCVRCRNASRHPAFGRRQ